MVMDTLIEPVGKLEQTVDNLKFGNPLMEVTGIVTAFMPTQYVIEQAIERRANLIISHEGAFFSHHDAAVGGEDPVYVTKKQLIEGSNLAIFRFHDYWHRYKPDGIMEGLIKQLEWEPYVREHQAAASLLNIPSATLREISEYVKNRLEIPYVRIIGDLDMNCTNLGMLAGYRGGGLLAIPLFEKEEVDLILYGEGPEWETPEYVREAIRQGKRKALIVLGHAESEEPGMKLLADRLTTLFPSVPVHYIKENPIFQVV
jgi:putative NIF3 family GTP cyclohydrolase 1 type 2